MKMIIITLPDFFEQEAFFINLLFDNGLELLHLRKPMASAIQVENLLNDINKKYHNRIVLHDFHNLAAKYNLYGIHLNSRNPHKPESWKGSVSKSLHSIEELKSEKAKYNYVSLSPIFNSISKKGYTSKFTAETLHELSRNNLIDSKVYALGGIDNSNIKSLKNYGFGGVMILGAAWKFLDNTENFKRNFHALHDSCN